MSRLKVVAAAHWFTALAFIILFATLVNAFFQLVQPDYRLPLIGHFPPFEWLIEVFAWGGLIGIVVLVADPAEEPPALGGRRGRAAARASSARRSGRPTTSRRRSSSSRSASCCCAGSRRPSSRGSSRRRSLALHFPLTGWMAGFWSAMSLPGARDLGLRRRDGQDPHLVRVDDHHLAAADDGRGLAPLPRLPQHLVQARASGRTALGAAKPLTIGGKPFDMEAMEELEEGDTLGVGRGRGLHLEGPARLLDVHRVRPLPVAVPCVEHREAAVPQAAHDDAARPRRRQGALPAGPWPHHDGDAEKAMATVAARTASAGCGRTGWRATVTEGCGHRLARPCRSIGDTGYDIAARRSRRTTRTARMP